jgi:carboxyl-terminal processing protease
MLVPGGPAWKTGDIHKEDEILQLQWKGKAPIDVSTVSVEEVYAMLARSNHDELLVKVKKPDGTIRTITLRKEKIETEEDIVKGFLLAGEKKVGYIALPDFYTQWEDEKGSGCANDVAKEIIKLKKENPEGLILDLRYNGGGSLYEALQLCGIFIDDGALVGVKEKDGKLTFGKDPNRGTIYDGPLVIMVNTQSASASELVAAALQDYNRAVIVGSPTYGKATMQLVFPLDSNAKHDGRSSNGYVKITTGKLFRLTGETAQRNGVIPDILLPDAFDGLEFSEKFMPYVLPADTARKNNYYKPLPFLPFTALKEKSKERISIDPYFTDLVKHIIKRKEEMATGKVTIPLRPDAFEKWDKEKEALEAAIEDEETTASKIFTVANHSMEKERLQNNEYAAALNKYAMESVLADVYIQEAFSIITDLIKLQKK